MEVEELSPVAQDYLKVIWSATEWGSAPITTSGLATRFDTSAANVSATMRRLAAQGLVSYEPYRPVRLTESGTRLAVAMVRRHRLLETFLAEVVGYAWQEVHDEAERLEHAVSDDFLTRIDALLGHPLVDPHGDPIPSAHGHAALPATIALLDADPGSYRVARVADDDPSALSGLAARGIVPGAALEVPIDLPPEHAAAVRVFAGPA